MLVLIERPKYYTIITHSSIDGLGKPQVLRIDKFGGTTALNRENFGLRIAHFFLMYEFR